MVTNRQLSGESAQLSTPLIANAALGLQLPARFAPPRIAPILAGIQLAGRALPVRSADIFLEAMQKAERGTFGDR